MSEQAAKASIKSTKAVFNEYVSHSDRLSAQRFETLKSALADQEDRLERAAAASSLRLSSQERLFASIEVATAKRVQVQKLPSSTKARKAKIMHQTHCSAILWLMCSWHACVMAAGLGVRSR